MVTLGFVAAFKCTPVGDCKVISNLVDTAVRSDRVLSEPRFMSTVSVLSEAFHVWVRITREISTQEDMRIGVVAVYEAADHLQSRVLMDNPWTTTPNAMQ